ncbi:MAG: NAD-dependent epimerase/dehydratase family protein [Ferruginibacter sp.]
MRILIIGNEGFIGSTLFKYYKKSSVLVWGADIISKTADNYFFINSASPDYDDVFQNTSFDICVNASGAANVNFSVSNPAWDFELNNVNVFRMLDAIRKFQPGCKFIHISSAAVYGNPNSLPVPEIYPAMPLSPYGFHKWQSEILCREFTTVYGIQSVIVRIFSAYGPGLKKQLFWDLYQKRLQSAPIEIFGTGAESRDFIFIDDIVQAIDIISRAPFLYPVINVANGIEVTIGDAAAVFFKSMGGEISYSFNGQARKGDPINWKADISILKGLGYNQQVSFTQGIEKYCKWLKSEKHH